MNGPNTKKVVKRIPIKAILILFIFIAILCFSIVFFVNTYTINNINILENTTNTSISSLSNSDLAYSINRNDYASNEQFANFRLVKVGKIKPIIYRGASPVDNTYNRATIVDELLRANKINYIIDLSDSENDFINSQKSNNYASKYSNSLYENGQIFFGCTGINYISKEFAIKMANSIAQIVENDGPYYIHCTHGRDRTGMACIILEALADASYEEILSDYMKTFENYNFVTKDNQPKKYEIIFNSRFKEAISYITREEKIENYSTYDYKNAAKNFLKYGGLTDAEIQALIEKITK